MKIKDVPVGCEYKFSPEEFQFQPNLWPHTYVRTETGCTRSDGLILGLKSVPWHFRRECVIVYDPCSEVLL